MPFDYSKFEAGGYDKYFSASVSHLTEKRGSDAPGETRPQKSWKYIFSNLTGMISSKIYRSTILQAIRGVFSKDQDFYDIKTFIGSDKRITNENLLKAMVNDNTLSSENDRIIKIIGKMETFGGNSKQIDALRKKLAPPPQAPTSSLSSAPAAVAAQPEKESTVQRQEPEKIDVETPVDALPVIDVQALNSARGDFGPRGFSFPERTVSEAERKAHSDAFCSTDFPNPGQLINRRAEIGGCFGRYCTVKFSKTATWPEKTFFIKKEFIEKWGNPENLTVGVQFQDGNYKVYCVNGQTKEKYELTKEMVTYVRSEAELRSFPEHIEDFTDQDFFEAKGRFSIETGYDFSELSPELADSIQPRHRERLCSYMFTELTNMTNSPDIKSGLYCDRTGGPTAVVFLETSKGFRFFFKNTASVKDSYESSKRESKPLTSGSRDGQKKCNFYLCSGGGQVTLDMLTLDPEQAYRPK